MQELSLPAVLRRILDTAKDLFGAKYAALGVIGSDRLTRGVQICSSLGRWTPLPMTRSPSSHAAAGSGRGVRRHLATVDGWDTAGPPIVSRVVRINEQTDRVRDRLPYEITAAHHVGSGRKGAAGRPVASVSNMYTSPAPGSARRCSSVQCSVAVVT